MSVNRREWMLGAAALTAVSACASEAPGVSPRGSATGSPPRELVTLSGAKVLAFPIEGGEPRLIADCSLEAARFGLPKRGVNDGVAIDRAAGHVYWTNMGAAAERDGFVLRADLAGGNVVVIVPPGGAWTPKQMRLDLKERRIYWSDREGMAVMRCRMDGSRIETLVVTGDPIADAGKEELWCVGLAIDPVRRLLYWTQKGGTKAGRGVIRRVGLDLPRGVNPSARPDIETLFAGLPEPIDLDLDLARGEMWWTDRGDNTVSRALTDAPGTRGPDKRKIVARGMNEAIGVALDFVGGRVAWTSLGGELGVASLDGSNPRILRSRGSLLTGVAWA